MLWNDLTIRVFTIALVVLILCGASILVWMLVSLRNHMTRRYGQDGFDKAAQLAKVVNILAAKTGTGE